MALNLLSSYFVISYEKASSEKKVTIQVIAIIYGHICILSSNNFGSFSQPSLQARDAAQRGCFSIAYCNNPPFNSPMTSYQTVRTILLIANALEYACSVYY